MAPVNFVPLSVADKRLQHTGQTRRSHVRAGLLPPPALVEGQRGYLEGELAAVCTARALGFDHEAMRALAAYLTTARGS